MQCRICGNKNLKKIFSLGETPLANSFLTKNDLNTEEKRFPLEVCFCDKCKLVQLAYIVPPEMMFTNYVYVTSTSNTFKIHFGQMAEEITKMFNLGKNSIVVDIGSNDGLLLKQFQRFGVNVVGVEPATNIAEIARKDGVETISDYFNENVVNKIIQKKGHVDVVTATNVFAHVNDIDSLAKNLKKILKEDGVFVIEVPYLVDMLEKMTFDTIYHEHLSYFSVIPLDYFFKKHGMNIFKIEKVGVHGGSLRVFVKKDYGKYKIDSSIETFIKNENKLGIGNFKTYEEFAKKVERVKTTLLKFLGKIKSEKKTIAGYGAPAKGNTLLNFCGVGKNYIDYIVDENTLKQGLYTPGTKIPVVNQTMLDKKTPNYILILAWNFADEILEKTKHYRKTGVKFIIPLPEPMII